MTKLLKNLEYLLPIFSQMPNWVRCLFGIWLILSITLLIVVSSITYSTNKEKSQSEKKHMYEYVKTHIHRLIEDTEQFCISVQKEFKKESNKTINNFAAKNTLHSGITIKILWEMAISYKERIDVKYKETTRKIEDILLNNFQQKDINNNDNMGYEAGKLKQLYLKCEEIKKQFENPARSADSRINKEKLVINDNFEIK